LNAPLTLKALKNKAAACPSDELVLYESPPDRYDHDQVKAVTSPAAAKGIAVWHLILGVREPTEMRKRVELMRKAGARFGFCQLGLELHAQLLG
jgi:hypothetical protein